MYLAFVAMVIRAGMLSGFRQHQREVGGGWFFLLIVRKIVKLRKKESSFLLESKVQAERYRMISVFIQRSVIWREIKGEIKANEPQKGKASAGNWDMKLRVGANEAAGAFRLEKQLHKDPRWCTFPSESRARDPRTASRPPEDQS